MIETLCGRHVRLDKWGVLEGNKQDLKKCTASFRAKESGVRFEMGT